MDLKEIRDKSNRMLANFVDEIGLDGDSYISTSNCPMAWGNPKLQGYGEYLEPGSERLVEIIQASRCDEKTQKVLNQKGLILIDRIYKQKEPNPDFFVTIIHETIHSNRNLLIFDAVRDYKNEYAYTYDNDKFNQNKFDYAFSYADASQEILKGSIDTSRKTVDNYHSMTSEEIEDIDFIEGNVTAQMEKQQYVDEALVDIMAALSYKLYSAKENGKVTNIWNELENLRDSTKGKDISAMSKIILKHHDFELFNWMLDPISYSQGDIHYDFFGKYTENDQDLLKEFYEAAYKDTEDIFDEYEI